MSKPQKKSFLREHSLSLVSASVLAAWIAFYIYADPHTHWGGFFGNAIADWTGLLVTVIATKYFYETGSAESRQPPRHWIGTLMQSLQDHSLTIFLVVTGAAWIVLYAKSDPGSKWGQVVGNIVSEWTQILGMVILTKKLVELHSKESRR